MVEFSFRLLVLLLFLHTLSSFWVHFTNLQLLIELLFLSQLHVTGLWLIAIFSSKDTYHSAHRSFSLEKHSTGSLIVSTAKVRRTLSRSNFCKAACPDNIHGGNWTDQLSRSGPSSIQAAVFICMKTTTIIPVPKSLLFVDFTSAFNTMIPQTPVNKLLMLGLSSSLCNWVLDFLANNPQCFLIYHRLQLWLPSGLYAWSPPVCNAYIWLLTNHPACHILSSRMTQLWLDKKQR